MESGELNRWQAGLTHLSLSAAIAGAAFLLIYLIWYPAAMAEAQGVSQLVLIMIGVDVALGPLITTIIWNTAKGKWLRFDLSVIGLVQIAALLFALFAIHGGRPAYLVFNIDRFEVTAFEEVDKHSLARARPESGLTFWGYRTVSARLPADPKERTALLFSSVTGGPDLRNLPHLFLPLEAERETMLKKMRPMSELRIANEMDATRWQDFLNSFARTEDELGYLPMSANLSDGAVVLDAKTADVLGIRMLTPVFSATKKEPN